MSLRDERLKRAGVFMARAREATQSKVFRIAADSYLAAARHYMDASIFAKNPEHERMDIDCAQYAARMADETLDAYARDRKWRPTE